jgi:hypothetical protein
VPWQGSSGVEQETHKLLVAGSNPAPATKRKDRLLAIFSFEVREKGIEREKEKVVTDLLASSRAAITNQ